jgi:hypothetical protein
LVAITRALIPVSGGRVLSIRSLVLVGTVLALLALTVDVGIYGPITHLAATTLVVRPVEKTWGFHAEWRTYMLGSRSSDFLTIVSVVPGGAFERAGIRNGFAFAPRRSATFGPYFGGPHSLLVGPEDTVTLRILQDPSGSWGNDSLFTVRRPAAYPSALSIST